MQNKNPWDNIKDAKQPTLQPTIVNQNKIPTIAIGIPYLNMEEEFIDKVYSPLKYIPTSFANKQIFLSKVPSIPVARNYLAKAALDINADYIWWLDTDHSFEDPTNAKGFADPNAALKALYDVINKEHSGPNSKKDKIVSGLYRAKQKVGFNYAAWMWIESAKGFSPIQEWTGNWLDIDVVGMGCCLMDTRVFKDVPKPWFHWDEPGEISEDFYFLRKAKEYGWNSKVFTDLKLSHIGKVKVRCDGTFTTPDL